MRRCVIFCASPDFSPEIARAEVCREDFVIACDGGYRHALSCGVRPDALVGDFDSYLGDLPGDIPVHRSPAEKDDTDGMLAVKLGMESGYSDFLLLGVTGGRMDHLLGNLACAAYIAKMGGRCEIRDRYVTMVALNGGQFSFKGMKGRTVSLMPHSDACTGVTLSGMKYPLYNATLTNSFPLGVSNVVLSGDASLTYVSGVLFVVLVNGECA